VFLIENGAIFPQTSWGYISKIDSIHKLDNKIRFTGSLLDKKATKNAVYLRKTGPNRD
jgi:hypothetical protein